LGRLHEEKKEYKKALEKYLMALLIFKQLKSPYEKLILKGINRIRETVGERKFRQYINEIESKIKKGQIKF